LQLKTKRVWVWCAGSGKPPVKGGSKAERCPVCGKKFILKTLDAEPHGKFEPFWKFPQHKQWIKKVGHEKA